MFLIYLTLMFCAIGVAAMVYRYDLYDKEPWYMMLLAVTMGAGVMWAVEPLEMMTFYAIGDRLAFEFKLALVAATHEEFAKLLVVAAIALCFRGVFNDPMDGLIYGSLAGLGAAIAESIDALQGTHAATTIAILPGAELVRLVGHAVMGGISGFGVGLIVIQDRRWPVITSATLLASMSLHFLWDVAALRQTHALSIHSVAAVGIMLTGFVVYGWLVVRAAALAREHFAASHHHRLFGWPLNRLFHREHEAAGE